MTHDLEPPGRRLSTTRAAVRQDRELPDAAMDRDSALRLLRRAQDHADSEAEHIKTQEEAVQRLASKGYDTTAAVNLLRVMRKTLAAYRRHCEALQHIISKM